MGLSIHYKGIIRDGNLINPLVDEIIKYCLEQKWSYKKISDSELKGIVFAPSKCEPLFFTFNVKNEIISPVYKELQINPVNTVSAKTGMAGLKEHVSLIKLIKMLKIKYFSHFELIDESGYWDSEDINSAKMNFQ